jgi:hypothetical protein
VDSLFSSGISNEERVRGKGEPIELEPYATNRVEVVTPVGDQHFLDCPVRWSDESRYAGVGDHIIRRLVSYSYIASPSVKQSRGNSLLKASIASITLTAELLVFAGSAVDSAPLCIAHDCGELPSSTVLSRS